MHVAQLPASHENGGRNPPRRAVSSTVSPAWYGTVCLRRSSRITTASGTSDAAATAGTSAGRTNRSMNTCAGATPMVARPASTVSM